MPLRSIRWLRRLRGRTIRHITVFTLALLLIEFLDELTFGVREAAWPLIRDDLNLDYSQVGILLGLPNLASTFIEPLIGILGDVWRRRVLVLGGGVLFGLALLLTALSQHFLVLLASFILLYPASGAFVSLSQATLMDTDPTRHEQNMARWTFAGSLGVVAGTFSVVAGSWLGVDWRTLFLLLAGLSFLLVMLAWRSPFPRPQQDDEEEALTLRQGIAGAFNALRRREVLLWLTLLQFSDFMLDILLGFLALYFVDVVGVGPEIAALAITIWTVVGLLGDFLLIPLLERVRGLNYLRISAAAVLLLYPAFLLVPDLWPKMALLALLGLFNAGWYAILQGQLYSSMPGRSGSVMAVSNIYGLVGGLLPIGFGWLAERYDLAAVMWLLALGPLALLVGIPRQSQDRPPA
ncbi:MAG TPA: MFS transporter [Chloroflexia bacterium]|jgi:FSR family fosmidomycin resistance protein-like MFS transporter